MKETKKKFTGIALLSFLASIAGIIIGFLLMKDDVTSTAHTLFNYFPLKYSVTPSSTWEGAIVLGLFTSVLQIVAASVVGSDKMASKTRWLAGALFLISCAFDNWTDVVYRSGNLTGNIFVAAVTTFTFYTVGSEAMQALSLLVFFSTWRTAISDIMWGVAVFEAGMRSIGAEWKRFRAAALRKEDFRKDSSPGIQPQSSPHKTMSNSGFGGSYGIGKASGVNQGLAKQKVKPGYPEPSAKKVPQGLLPPEAGDEADYLNLTLP